MTHDAHHPPTLGDIAYEAFFSAAVGGSVIALFFLLLDSLAGRPLLTPSLVGSALFFGESGEVLAVAEAVAAVEMAPVRLDAVAYTTVLHFVAFGVLGLAAALAVRAVERRASSFLVAAGVLLLLTEGGFLIAGALFMPGVAEQIGTGRVLLANVLASVAMAAFLRQAHLSASAHARQGQALSGGEAAPPS